MTKTLLNKSIFLFLLTLATQMGWAAKVIGIKFADTYSHNGSELVLNGIGLRKVDVALGLRVNVYAGALYLAAKNSNPQDIIQSKTAKVVRLGYAREVGKDKARETWKTNFEKICGSEKSFCFKDKAIFETQFISAIDDIEEDQYQEFIIDGAKLKIISNKKEKALIENTQLGQFVLNVWLLSPPNPELASGMLGQADFSKE
jgi:hypothetical protein